MADYRLNQKGKGADPRLSMAGKVLDFMKEKQPVANPAEVAYEFDIAEEQARVTLDGLVKAKFVDRVDEGRVI